MRRARTWPGTALGAALLASVLAGCATSPTGQRQLLLFPEGEMAAMGGAAYQQIKQETPVSAKARTNRYVQCVARAITREVPGGTPWEVTVFDDERANAFALPGGKVGVYAGLLDVARDQDQLAAVIGHEIAHVTARHGNARVSAAYATQAGLTLAQALAGAQTAMKQQLLGLLGVGAQYGVLMPYGRGQESEADVIGLELMARAGFDPRASVALWRNMAAQGGGQPPAFLSTHPSHEQRIRGLEARMPEVLRIYRRARAAGKEPDCG